MRFLSSMLILSLLVISCNKDGIFFELRFDGNNNDAPSLPAGSYQMAAKFTSSQTNQYEGREIEQISFYLKDLPSRCELRLYDQGQNNAPGDLLYEANVTGDMQRDSWNDHIMESVITISGEELWLVVRVVHDKLTQSLGCDEGPASENGDLILHEINSDWETFRNFTNGTADINWNVRIDLN